MSITEIISQVSKNGIARTNRYRVTFTPPAGISVPDGDSFSITCEISAFPGRGFTTNDRRTFGPLQKLPYEKLFNEITMNFRCSQDMRERAFFEEWLNTVSGASHQFAYYQDYVGTVEINQLSNGETVEYTLVLLEVYPTLIGDLSLEQENFDDYHKLPVTFVFKESIEPNNG